jgi:hypothetical protein
MRFAEIMTFLTFQACRDDGAYVNEGFNPEAITSRLLPPNLAVAMSDFPNDPSFPVPTCPKCREPMRLVRSKTHGAKFHCPAHDHSLTVRDVATRHDLDNIQPVVRTGSV